MHNVLKKSIVTSSVIVAAFAFPALQVVAAPHEKSSHSEHAEHSGHSEHSQHSKSAHHDSMTQSQSCLTARAAEDDVHLATIDAFVVAQKAAIQARSTALKAAAGIADDTQRSEAVKKADKDYKQTLNAALKVQTDAEKSVKDAMLSACGGTFGGAGKKAHGH